MRLLDFTYAALVTTLFAARGVLGIGGANPGFEESQQIQRDQLKRMRDFLGPDSDFLSKRQAPPQTINFSNPAAQQFFVPGTSLPDVNFDAGPSWSGLLPISGDPNETRKLFFWFWPTNNITNGDKLLFWTNGGPGCSSLEGFLQENGPISWSWGQSEPTPNPFAWTNLAHMLWVEQPVGTGFSQGTPNITNDDELAAQLVGFLGQFLEVFSELKGKDFFLSGESYAGFYVPYIANFIYENPDLLDLNLKGIDIADPSLSYDVVQDEIPALRFAQAHADLFPFTQAQWAEFQNISDTCGYTDYLDKFVTYPPAGQLPFPAGVVEGTFGTLKPGCRLHSPIQQAVGVLNPVFDVYRVSDTFPSLWSVLGFPESTQQFIYFNRTDVQDAIHAPHINWDICSEGSVYVNAAGRPGNDQSVASMLSVFPNVIEKSERVVVVHGLADFILVAEGTRIAIQNMTWNGAQGFQTPIENETFTVKNFGVFGNEHTERGLTYLEFYYSGHMTPQFVPWAAYNAISFLLGLQDSPST
ncbi:alpha/beta-hydrolase [Lentinula edodes]|uniref:alpha/beta-hydrolase n=1 Tax=Lentinula edodes TaxID=5353 RepID=UPI001E8E0FF3|nr:alpha/beta-hydrolase [Lentinula edodes]KAH7876749.1 alpha/beta-hydrolase [Lentinula edodes]KAJ3900931.1 alpha/beta-hydrolase [Lentinula edodes]